MIQVIVHDNALPFFCHKKTMWAWVIVGVVVLLVVAVLLMPIQLYLNTIKNEYFIRLGHLAKAYLEGDKKEIVRFRFWVLGYRFFLYPFKKKTSRKAIEEPKKKMKKRKFNVKRVFRLVSAFKIHAFELNLDTGNYVTNAQLYPIFGFFNHHFATCQINFKGINSLVVDIRSRPLTVLKSIIHF